MAIGKVIKSLFVESGTYQDMKLRSYETVFNTDTANSFMNATEGGTAINQNAIAHVASDILRPSAAVTAGINIDNGWQGRRMTFMLELGLNNGTNFNGNMSTIVINGYTSHADVSPFSKSFDPSMRLYINSSTILQSVMMSTPTGQQFIKKQMLDTSHVLGRNVIDSISTTKLAGYNDPYAGSKLFWLTPKNVIHEMTNTMLSNQYHGDMIIDSRYASNPAEVHRTRRDNTTSSNFLTRVIGAVSNEYKQVRNGTSAGEFEALSNAAFSTKDLTSAQDPLLASFFRHTGYLTNGYVTWAELCALFPNLNDETLFMLRSDAVVNSNTITADAGNFQHWNGIGYETVIANILSQNIPAIMTSCLIGQVHFSFTNDTPGLVPQMAFTGGAPLIDGLSFKELSGRFQYRFISEIVPMITHGNRVPISIHVNSNIGTETTMVIQYDSGESVPFCAPTFCDAMYSPIIGVDSQQITDIASDLHNFATTVVSNQFGY